MTNTPKRTYPPARPKVPPFARYEGTSAWRHNRIRVRAYNLFRAATQSNPNKAPNLATTDVPQ